jgi:hypothetical protein
MLIENRNAFEVNYLVGDNLRALHKMAKLGQIYSYPANR